MMGPHSQTAICRHCVVVGSAFSLGWSSLYQRLDTLDTHWIPARAHAHRIHQSAQLPATSIVTPVTMKLGNGGAHGCWIWAAERETRQSATCIDGVDEVSTRFERCYLRPCVRTCAGYGRPNMNRLGGWMINMGGGTCAPNPSIFPSNLFGLAIAAALAGSLIQVACQARILLQISGLYLRLARYTGYIDTYWTPARGHAQRIHQSAHPTFLVSPLQHWQVPCSIHLCKSLPHSAALCTRPLSTT